MSEPFSWSKFFAGLVDPTAYFKTLAIVIRIALVILVCFVVYMACVKVHAMLAPKKQQPSVFTVTGQAGGMVKNSSDQKETKFGLLNF
jgi:hypothetical protein